MAVLLDLFHCIAANVPDGYAAIFCHFAHDLDKFLAPLLAQFGKEKTDGLALDGGRQAEVALLNRFFDRMQRVGIPGLDSEGARLRRSNAGQLADAHLRAIYLY